MMLDMRTAFVTYELLTIVGALFLFVLWTQNKRQFPEVKLWFLSYVFASFGIGLIILRGVIPDALSMIGGNGLIALSWEPLLVGLERHFRVRRSRIPNLIIIAVLVAGIAYYAVVDPTLAARNIAIALAIGYFSVRCAVLVFSSVRPELYVSARIFAYSTALMAVTAMARIALVLNSLDTTEFFSEASVDVFIIMIWQMLTIGMFFGLTLIINGKLAEELKDDILKRELAEDELTRSKNKFSIAFENVPAAILISEQATGKIIEANHSFFTMMGVESLDVIGKSSVDLNIWVSLEARKSFLNRLSGTDKVSNMEVEYRRSSGEVFPAIVSAETIDIEGIRHTLVIIQDVTERKIAENVLHDLSSRDPLTGILNRRAFFEKVNERLAETSEGVASIVFFDIDNLKHINDTRGHVAGDQAIVFFARAISDIFRESDIICRMGGDEFAVCTVHRSMDAAKGTLERFENELKKINDKSNLPFAVNASCGVETVPLSEGPVSLDHLIQIADDRMYEAKRLDRKSVV